MDLHRRSLGTQGKAVSRIESVLGRARGMGLRDVQCVEVVEVGFNFPIVLDRITKSDKDVFNLFAQKRDWMQVALTRSSSRERDIDTLLLDTRLIDIFLQSQFRTLDSANNASLARLNNLTEGRAVLSGNSANALLAVSERALLAKVTCP